MPTFTYLPDIGADEEHQPRVNTVKFGDGYEQRTTDGLNTDLCVRKLIFSGRSAATNSAIIAFLKSQGGVTSFTYTHPNDVARQYVCRTWSFVDNDYTSQIVTAQFDEVPL